MSYPQEINDYEEYDKMFRERWNHMFAERNAGFSVPRGWRQIVWDMMVELECLELMPKLIQIKEKFGGLRVYAEAQAYKEDVARFARIYDKAVYKASKTCAVCSEPGELRVNDYMAVLCEKHHKETLK